MMLEVPIYDPAEYRERSVVSAIAWTEPARQDAYDMEALRALAARAEMAAVSWVRVGPVTDKAWPQKGYLIFLDPEGRWARGPYSHHECRAFLDGMLAATTAAEGGA